MEAKKTNDHEANKKAKKDAKHEEKEEKKKDEGDPNDFRSAEAKA